VENIEEKEENKEEQIIIACRSKVKIGNKNIDAIIDTGAATSIITKGLQEELGLKIEKGSRARFTIANGLVVPAIGKLMIEIEIEKEKIPMEIQVIDSRKKDLIIGTKFLAEIKGVIDLDIKELRIKRKGKEIRTKIFFNKKKYEIYEEIRDEEYEKEYEEEQELYEESSEEEKEKWEEYGEYSPAYYLAEMTN
jgi:predicted aspartyl protease